MLAVIQMKKICKYHLPKSLNFLVEISSKLIASIRYIVNRIDNWLTSCGLILIWDSSLSFERPNESDG